MRFYREWLASQERMHYFPTINICVHTHTNTQKRHTQVHKRMSVYQRVR